MRLDWMKKVSPIGLDIGARRIKAVQLLHGRLGTSVRAVANFPRLNAGTQLDEAEIRRVVEVLSRRSFAGAEVVIATPLEKQITATLELPPITSGISLDPIARAEFSRSQKCEPGSFELAFWKLPAATRATKNTDVMAIGCLHVDSEALIDMMAVHGLEVIGLDAHSTALARGVADQIAPTDEIVVMVELGWTCAALVILYRGIVIYERVLGDSGLKSLYQIIESTMKIDANMVDCVLTNSGLRREEVDPTRSVTEVATDSAAAIPSAFRHDVRMVLTSHLQGIFEEIQESVSYTSHRYPDATVNRLLLTGGGAMISGIEEFMTEMAGMVVQIGRPVGVDSSDPVIARECDAGVVLAGGLANCHQENS